MRTPARLLVALGAASALLLGPLTPVASAASHTTTTSTRTATATTAPRAGAVQLRRDLVDVPARDLVQRAVTPSECGPTLLDAYVDGLFASMTDEQFTFLLEHLNTLLNVPTYEALLLGTTGDPDFALGPHAQQITKTFRDLRRFWDIRSGDIQLMAMHGDVLLDAGRIARTLRAMAAVGVIAPITAADALAEGRTVAAFMRTQGSFVDNPLWTFNAFAFSGEGDPDPVIAALPDKLIVGDGILAAYDEIGLGDVGPRVILAHEFGHHVQFELGVFATGPTDPAEATRRTELMADALATYFAVHKKGLALNKKRVVDALLSFYTVGDCQFTSPGHHGTPLQRQRAADWGADLAAASKPASRVLPAAEVVRRFDAALASIVNG